MYARTFFVEMDFDSVTIVCIWFRFCKVWALDFEGKWAIVLALTSNEGGLDFQMIEDIGASANLSKGFKHHSKLGREHHVCCWGNSR